MDRFFCCGSLAILDNGRLIQSPQICKFLFGGKCLPKRLLRSTSDGSVGVIQACKPWTNQGWQRLGDTFTERDTNTSLTRVSKLANSTRIVYRGTRIDDDLKKDCIITQTYMHATLQERPTQASTIASSIASDFFIRDRM